MVDKNILQTLSRAEWEGIIYQRIFSERDRWLVARHLLDGVPYDRLTAVHLFLFPVIPPNPKDLSSFWDKLSGTYRAGLSS